MNKPIPYGTRVKYYDKEGIVGDPDGPNGQLIKGYRPPYDAIWVKYPERIHGQNKLINEKSDGSTYITTENYELDGAWFKPSDLIIIS